MPRQDIRRKMTTIKIENVAMMTTTAIGKEAGTIIPTPVEAVIGTITTNGIKSPTVLDTIGNHTNLCGDQIYNITRTTHSENKFTSTIYHSGNQCIHFVKR